jgi:hypothetical protein
MQKHAAGRFYAYGGARTGFLRGYFIRHRKNSPDGLPMNILQLDILEQ